MNTRNCKMNLLTFFTIMIFSYIAFFILSITAAQAQGCSPLFCDVTKVVIFSDNYHCGLEKDVSMDLCYPPLKGIKIPSILSPYSLAQLLKEKMDDTYTLPPQLKANNLRSEDFNWRNEQPVEILKPEDAKGEYAKKLRADPSVLFVHATAYGIPPIMQKPSTNIAIVKIFVLVNRFSNELNPFTNRFYSCDIDPSLPDTEIKRKLQSCFSNIVTIGIE